MVVYTVVILILLILLIIITILMLVLVGISASREPSHPLLQMALQVAPVPLAITALLGRDVPYPAPPGRTGPRRTLPSASPATPDGTASRAPSSSVLQVSCCREPRTEKNASRAKCMLGSTDRLFTRLRECVAP